jgi:hypothetical protein
VPDQVDEGAADLDAHALGCQEARFGAPQGLVLDGQE